jgi:hypothetical protein
VDALSHIYPTIRFVHASPGFVASSWGSGFPFFLRALVRLLQVFATHPDVCAHRLVRPLLEKSPGFFLVDQYGNNVNKLAEHSAKKVKEVWSKTEKVLVRAVSGS